MDLFVAWLTGFACCLGLVFLTRAVRPRESFSRGFERRLERKMSQLSDGLVSLETEVSSAETRVSGDVAALRQQIADLEAQLAAGTATPADIAKLAELQQRVHNIDPAIVSPAPAP